MSTKRAGFTLIELMVALAIAVILLMLAAPLYGQWIADTQVSSGAESIVSGLRSTLNEAIKRNTSVELVLDPTTKTGGWTVQLPAGGGTLTAAGFTEGADRATFTVSPAGSTTVTFTALGVVAAQNADGSAPFEQVDVTQAAASRPLRVLVPVNTPTGRTSGIRVCDPKWSAIDKADPKACPDPTP